MVVIASDAAALALPPTTELGYVPSWWSGESGVVPEFELEIWANATIGLTGATLYSATPHPLVFADVALDSVTHGTETLNEAAHTFFTGDGPVRLTTSNTLPTGLALATDYWLIKTGAGTLQVAETLEDALAGTPVPFTDAGVGVHTIVDTATTERLHWTTHDGLLGLAGDGVIALTSQVGYRKRIPHSPRAVAYSLVAAMSASDPEFVSAALVPIMDRP